MKLIKTIKDKDLPEDQSNIRVRESARAILFNKENLMPLMFVSTDGYHKLPGGGIKKGEDKMEALFRECREEVGAEIEVSGEIGKVFEYRSEWAMKQTSYCYYGKIISIGTPNFTERELAKEFQVEWVTLEEAISKMKKDIIDQYEATFINQRDLAFLQYANEKLSG